MLYERYSNRKIRDTRAKVYLNVMTMAYILNVIILLTLPSDLSTGTPLTQHEPKSEYTIIHPSVLLSWSSMSLLPPFFHSIMLLHNLKHLHLSLIVVMQVHQQGINEQKDQALEGADPCRCASLKILHGVAVWLRAVLLFA